MAQLNALAADFFDEIITLVRLGKYVNCNGYYVKKINRSYLVVTLKLFGLINFLLL
jgi:hypothetical protein